MVDTQCVGAGSDGPDRDGHLVEQHVGSWERHRKGGIKNPARWPG